MVKILSSLFLASSLFASNLYSEYKVDKEYRQFFNNCDKLLNKKYYLNCYNYDKKSSLAVAYKLEKEILESGHIQKRPKFETDYELSKKYRTEWKDYLHSGYDRGHILSNQSMNATTNAQRSTFLMSNITPQVPEINRKLYLKAERYERSLALKLGYIDVLNIIVFDENPKTISKKRIAVPKAYIKVFKHKDFKQCFYIPNNKEYEDYKLKKLQINCNQVFES